MLANAVKCFDWDGWGSVSYFNYVLGKPKRLICLKCHGSGQLCADCHQPEGVCECVAAEPCPTCGKGACRCG